MHSGNSQTTRVNLKAKDNTENFWFTIMNFILEIYRLHVLNDTAHIQLLYMSYIWISYIMLSQ